MSKAFIGVLLVAMLFMTVSAGYTPRALEDEILSLPDATLDSRQFASYIKIANKTTDMFYWFVEAENNPETAPVMWVSNGGPGCSGLIGFFTEWGPFQPVKAANGSIKLAKRDYGWTQNFNMVFVEQPNVGFTNIDAGKEPTIWNDQIIAERNAEFIALFFDRFSNYKANPFVILSESMGGHYIPTLANQLIKEIATPRLSFLNFQFSVVGNPLVYLPYRDYGYYAMLINRHLVPFFPLGKQYKETCMPDATKQPYPPTARPVVCDSLEYQMDKFTVAVDPYGMSFPICVDKNGSLKSSSPYLDYFAEAIASTQKHYKSYTALDQLNVKYEAYHEVAAKHSQGAYDQLLAQINGEPSDYFPPNYQPCEEDYTVEYLNRKDVQASIHANLKRSRWTFCAACKYEPKSFGESMIPYYKSNKKNRPALKQIVFSGTDDTMCSTVEADMAFFNNDFKQISQNVMLTPEGQMLGVETVFDELTYLTVHGAGHMIPSTRPHFNKYAVERYLLGKI